MYGVNPHYTLAETPYARMTGLFTPLSSAMIPNLDSFLQPMFVDMNPYFGNSGVPRYASFIGGGAMQNPQIPIIQPGQVGAWQQQFNTLSQQYSSYPQYGSYQQQQYPSYQQYGSYPQQEDYEQTYYSQPVTGGGSTDLYDDLVNSIGDLFGSDTEQQSNDRMSLSFSSSIALNASGPSDSFDSLINQISSLFG
jgi:hypothetical protein